MIVEGTVVAAQDGRFRVNCSGSVSSWMPRTTSAARITAEESGSITVTPPAVGDKVLCWFPGDALCDGYITGIEEG